MKPPSSKERGFVLACVCIVLALLFALAAGALDAGSLYLWRLRLEKATRAGAVAGLGYRALKGWQTVYGGPPKFDGADPHRKVAASGSEMAQLLVQSRNVVLENLRASYPASTTLSSIITRLRFEDDEGVFTDRLPTNAYNPVDDSIVIRAKLEVPTILAGRLEGLGVTVGCSSGGETLDEYCTVATEQRAQLASAAVAMVLDTSGSMICEESQPTCTCRNDPVNPCGSGGRRSDQIITHLKNAALDFHAFFNPFRDRIAIVPFNLAARVARPIVRRSCKSGAPAATASAVPFGETLQSYKNFIASLIGGYPVSTPASVGAIKAAILNDALLSPVESGFDDCIGSDYTVSGLIPVSNTNPCDGLIRAGNELRRARDVLNAGASAAGEDRTPLAVVFFTDGAPNAFRGAFMDPALLATNEPRTEAALSAQVPLTCGANRSDPACNDWYQYAIEWRDLATPLPYRGPGPLVHGTAAGDLFNFQITVNDVTDSKGVRTITPVTYPMRPPFGRTAVNCGENRAEKNLFNRVLRGFSPLSPSNDNCTQHPTNKSLRLPDGTQCGCLETLDFGLPTLSPIVAGRYTAAVKGVNFSYPYVSPSGNVNIPATDQLPYYCAIEAADWIRTELEAPVFTIGLGQSSPWCGDPMQDADNHFKRKDYFLSRLAFSPASVGPNNRWDTRHKFSPRGVVTITNTTAACSDHRFEREQLTPKQMQFGYNAQGNGAVSGDRPPSAFPPGSQGDYYGADQASQLSTLFTQTAKQILLRLGT